MDNAGIAFIASFEKPVLHPYNDGTNHLTIGFGHLVRSGESFPQHITMGQALTLYRSDISRVVNPALDRITGNLNQNQVNAVGSFIFNAGGGRAFRRLILPSLNSGDYSAALQNMSRFHWSTDPVSHKSQDEQGLRTRRGLESDLFQRPEK